MEAGGDGDIHAYIHTYTCLYITRCNGLCLDRCSLQDNLAKGVELSVTKGLIVTECFNGFGLKRV